MPANERILLITLGLLSILFSNFCSSEPFIEILDIRTTSERSLLTSKVEIHNRSCYDVNMTVHQEFIGHTLFMSIHLKAELDRQLTTIKQWRNIDLCQFLIGENRDPLLKVIFENTWNGKDFPVCPFKVGPYRIRETCLDAKKIPAFVPKSRYRLYFEVTQMMGDAPKLFSMKIDAVYSSG